MTAAVQTLWAELIARTLAATGAGPCVISPGSRSTPLVVALVRSGLEVITIIDERAAAFFALGAARATGRPAVLACTSGSAVAHYLPALVEASTAGVPLVVVTADRPPELHDCGASQTIDQRAIYGGFVVGDFDLGAPVASELAFRAVHRKLVQAATRAVGPVPGPVHINVPLRKPLEPAAPSTHEEREVARVVDELCPRDHPAFIRGPALVADPAAIVDLARAILREPHGLIVAGAMPVAFGDARDLVFELARLAGYPIVAETGSQLRFAPRPDGVARVDHFDLIADKPRPSLLLQLGCEPVAASWPAFVAMHSSRWVLANSWRDPDSSATVVLGDPGATLRELVRVIREQSFHLVRARRLVERTAATREWNACWRRLDDAAAHAVARAIADHADGETALVAAAIAALPDGAMIQVGNSLPIRVIDHVPVHGSHPVITQRGAAGIDGLIASAAGATHAGVPVLLVLGDVSFACDVGGLLSARSSKAPLAILVVDNGGGQIFAGLPIARAGLGDTFAACWLTAPGIDPAAIARVLGARAITADSPNAAASAIARALATIGPTVIHAPVAASGAHDTRRFALELQEPVALATGGYS